MSIEQAVDAARTAGLTGESLVIAVAIAGGESGWNPNAHNPVYPDDSYGLWQINMLGDMGAGRRVQYGITTNSELFDPYVNGRAMFQISGGGANWQPWSVYTNGSYGRYLDQARQAVGSGGGSLNPAYPVPSGPEFEGMTPDFAGRLNALMAVCSLSITSGYRDPELQFSLWQEALAKYGSEDEARNWVAPAFQNPDGSFTSSSNHTKGLAADLGGDLGCAHAKAAEFGLHFPMSWEEWHIEPIDLSGSGGGKVGGGGGGGMDLLGIGKALADLVGYISKISDWIANPRNILRVVQVMLGSVGILLGARMIGGSL